MTLGSTLAASGLLLFATVTGCNREPGDGPLDASGSGTAYVQVLDVGERFSIGLPFVGNLGEKDAVIEQVRLIRVTGPVEVLGLRTRPFPDDGPTLSFGMYDFPPSEKPSHDPTKVNVVPGDPELTEAGTPAEILQLIIGVKVTSPGVAGNRGVEVTYRVGDKRYREVWNDAFELCAPKTEYGPGRQACPPPGFEYGDRVVEVPFG